MCPHHFTLQFHVNVSTPFYTAVSCKCFHAILYCSFMWMRPHHFTLQSTGLYTAGSHECVHTALHCRLTYVTTPFSTFHCRLTRMCDHHFTLQNHTNVNTRFDFHCRLTWTPASWFCAWCWRRERVSCPLSVWPARMVSLTWGWSWTAPRSSPWASLPSATSCASCRYTD